MPSETLEEQKFLSYKIWSLLCWVLYFGLVSLAIIRFIPFGIVMGILWDSIPEFFLEKTKNNLFFILIVERGYN